MLGVEVALETVGSGFMESLLCFVCLRKPSGLFAFANYQVLLDFIGLIRVPYGSR